MYEDVLARMRRVLGEDHPLTLNCAEGLAVNLHALHRLTDAIELLKDVRARSLRVLGAKHPDTVHVTQNLADALTFAGRRYEAQQLTGRKLNKDKRRFGRKRR